MGRVVLDAAGRTGHHIHAEISITSKSLTLLWIIVSMPNTSRGTMSSPHARRGAQQPKQQLGECTLHWLKGSETQNSVRGRPVCVSTLPGSNGRCHTEAAAAAWPWMP